jgi:hemolysin III
MAIDKNRPQTLGEEIANSVSHGLGALAALAVTPLMVASTTGTLAVTGVSLFGGTMFLLYLSSCLYHALANNRAKRLFKIFDHSAIFLLIAGTYTPFTLSILPPPWGWLLFGAVWALAIFGVVMKSVWGANSGRLSLVLYLGMGWMAVLAAKPLYESLSDVEIFWVLGGGIMYSLGTVFYANDHRIRYGHFVWHLFVMAGTACHVVAVLRHFQINPAL